MLRCIATRALAAAPSAATSPSQLSLCHLLYSVQPASLGVRGAGEQLVDTVGRRSWTAPQQAPGQQLQIVCGFAADAHKVELHAGLKKQQLIESDAQPKEYAHDLLAYSEEYMEGVRPVHKPPRDMTERLAYWAIQGTRAAFDWATGYKHDVPQSEMQWLRRCIFLETVAGVPGMVAGMLRHLRSLRIMQADKGWISTLLEEAENERMHLLTFMGLRNPDFVFRAMVLLAQGVYFNIFFISYLIAPRFCHAIVGYLEEEAVKTYTHLLSDIDAGHLWKDRPAPATGVAYWKLKPNAMMRDMVLAIRADEACHSHVNHTLSEIPADAPNPFLTGAAAKTPGSPSPGAALKP